MKFLALALVVTSFSSFAAVINSAKLDAAKQNLLVDVSYGGGCSKHTFELALGDCLESMPVQCSARLIHRIEGGFDACEAYLHETVVFNLAKYGLNDPYFSRGKLTIVGAKKADGTFNSATVRLP